MSGEEGPPPVEEPPAEAVAPEPAAAAEEKPAEEPAVEKPAEEAPAEEPPAEKPPAEEPASAGPAEAAAPSSKDAPPAVKGASPRTPGAAAAESAKAFDALEQHFVLGDMVEHLPRGEKIPEPPPPLMLQASAFLNVGAFEQLVENRCVNLMYPLEVRIDQCERELEQERAISMNLRDAIKALRAELLAEKDERAAMDDEIINMFPPLEEDIRFLQEAQQDTMRRCDKMEPQFDEIRATIVTKAEKSSVEQVRRALDVETELNATKFSEVTKRFEGIEHEVSLKISHREAKEMFVQVGERFEEQMLAIQEEARVTSAKIAKDLEDETQLLRTMIDTTKAQIPPIIKDHKILHEQVQTIPPRIDTLDTKVKTMQGQLMDTEQRLNDTKLQIDQVSKTIQKQAQKEKAVNFDDALKEIERLKSLRDDIKQLHDRCDDTIGDIADVRDLVTLSQKDFRQKTDVLCEADAERAKQTAWLTSQTRLVQEDQDQVRGEIEGLKKGLKNIDNTERIARDITFCKSEVKRLTNENKSLVDSLKGYYSHVKYMPEHVARRFHAVRKGVDVRLGKEHLAATSQSDNARHGFIPGGSGDHGFVMGDGPLEQSPAGQYYEFELVEKFSNVVGMKGGLLCGYSETSPEMTSTHLTGVVLDGVIVGGVAQVVNITRTKEGRVVEKAEHGPWKSEVLQESDRVGVLITPTSVLAVFVNGVIMVAEQVTVQEDQRVYPLIRVMGNAKTVKLLPGSQPPRSAANQILQLRGSA